ncbi:MAG TPA: 4Fe-4S binding protein [Syntrophothermus lipocalidus]|uniref:Ferredoxin n=1 Tax=Syntrophothermus lipocalidus (strain DSM 12680 / TGB-C1) TaxID=643648 RepID=D7CNS2_SYNLT|nr:4Fe-4S binding protein [Syntrophothermus lipocalidus]ADI02357.1 4Fe-4S ferredoxin iron-sulfur binding domain protein [Syntrophothermus lipocalidus DSM 12680]HHV75834.1 4Fe-4S binding protein [Syntrophothermus lipocalidus]
MHHYHRLQELLNTHPVGAPKSEEFIEILKILFRPDEIELALLLDFKLKKANEIAKQAGISQYEVMQRFEAMADRGVILAKRVEGEPAYALLPNYPGLFEYPIMRGGDSDTQARLAELWQAYYMKHMAAELSLANPPWLRVLPAEEALTEDFEILPFEIASQMMAKTKKIALANCPCRLTEKKCSKPIDVCLSFDGAADFLAERGIAREISLDEAREVLKRAEEAGLVHTGSNNRNNLLFICNCCPCCCHMLRLVTEHNYPNGLAKSSYLARIDAPECIGCGICAEERCPVKAIEMIEDIAVLNNDRCIGCGLCVSKCPTNAISLVKRDDYEFPPETVRELSDRVARNKETKRGK